MVRKISTILLLMIISMSGIVQSQTVQAGISSSGTSLIISAKPNGDLSGNYSGGNVTIIWPTSYGISIGTITSAIGGPWAQQGDVGTSGSDSYVDIGWTGSSVSINWANGSTNELFRVAVNQTGSGTGTFTLTDDLGGAWYFEVGGLDYTNYSDPFYANSVANVPLPVELTSFTGIASVSNVDLKWQTATEVKNHGFEIERSQKSEVGSQWEKVGFVKGNGSSNSTKDYSFTDKSINGGGKFSYRLKQIDVEGSYSYSETIEVTVIPTQFKLSQNYPNPFNPSTVISYQLPVKSNVQLKVYDILGNEVATLVDEQKEPGYYEVEWNASQFASGVYIHRMKAGNFIDTKKMILLR